MVTIRRDGSSIDLLERIPLFAVCSRDELRIVSRVLSVAEVPAGTVLCEEGQFGEEVYVVADGEAVVTIGEVEVGRSGPGDFVGEMSLLEHEHRVATVTAVTPMTVLVFGPRAFATMIHGAPSVVRRMMLTLSARLRAVERFVAAAAPAAVGAGAPGAPTVP